MINQYISNKLTPVTLKQLVRAGRQLPHLYVNHSLRHELCVRLSHQIKRLQSLPDVRPVKHLLRVHEDTFESIKLTNFSSNPMVDLHRCLYSVQGRHINNVETLMEGKRLMEPQDEKIDSTVTDFLKVHIGFQLLIRQYIVVVNKIIQGDPNYLKSNNADSHEIVGIVDTNCDLKSIVDEAIDEACTLTEKHMESSPDVFVDSIGSPVSLCCIPSHVHHTIFEMLKNSLEATAKAHRHVISMLPSVRVKIVWGAHEAAVVVADEGGGMSRAEVEKAFQYLYSSSESFADREEKHREVHSYQPVIDILSGFGIGLPFSRLLATHFGGDLVLQSFEGYGTNAALYIPYDEIPENIPLSWE